MKMLGLPGRDPATDQWLQDLLGRLVGAGSDSNVHGYRHWHVAGDPDITYEAGLVADQRVDLVVAKSLGTMVLLAAAQQGFQPSAAVLIGVPVRAYSDDQLQALQQFVGERPCLCIQQAADFTGPFRELEQVLGGSNTTLVEVAGDDHIYSDTAELATQIEAWRAGLR